MKNFLHKISITVVLLLLFGGQKVLAQAGVGPAPYCFPMYSTLPCNQPGPSNAGGNWINDFINSFNTTGAITNITNNGSGCNAQTFAGVGIRNYFYHGCQHYLVVSPGQVITCNFQSGNIFSQGFATFVDWNQDGVFNTTNERVVTTGVPPAGTFVSGNFTIPAGQAAGMYRMRVRCAYATSGTFIDPCNNYGFGETEDYNLYVSPASPGGVITATATANSPLCSGQTLSLSVSSSASPSVAVTYTWTGPAAYTSTLQNPSIVNSNTTMTGIYTVVVNPGGCPVTKTVQVSVNPTPTISSVTNDGPKCSGTTLNLSVTANPSAVTAGTVGYTWGGPNSFASNIQNPGITNSSTLNTGVYNVTVTNTFTNGGVCTNTGTTSAFIVPISQVSVSPATSTLCQNSNISFNSGAASATSYSWTGPSAFTSTITNPSLTNISPLNSGNYTVTAYFTSPGTTLVCSSSAVSNLSVVPRNPVTALSTPNVCQYATGTLSANAVDAYGYQWTGPNNFFSTASNTSIANIQPISAGVYSVTAFFSIGTVTCSTSNATQINVVPVNPIIINPAISVCYPANVPLQASSQSALTYFWNGPNSFTANVPNPVLYVPTPTASGVYTITTSYNNGILTCYNSNTTQVTVNPIITFTLPDFNRTCYNSPFTVNGPGGATSYTWTSSNGYSSNAQNLYIPGILPNQSGTYTLDVQLGPCITRASTSVEVLSPMQFTLTPNSRVICRGDSVKFVMGSTGGSQNYAYQWNPQVFLGSPTGSVATGVPIGTTIYNVTGYDIACPQYSITHMFTVQVNQPPKPDLQLERLSGCEPLCLFYDTKTEQESAITTYDFGGDIKMQADSFTYCLTQPGTYNLKIYSKGKNGCFGTYEFPEPIVVFPKPHTSLVHDPELPSTANNQVTFYPNHQYGPVVRYEWFFLGSAGGFAYDTSSQKNPVRVYDNVGKYPVMVISTTDKGCIDTVYKILDIQDEMTVYIPNTFTPNGDNLNDIFSLKGVGLKLEGYSMEIFDRWGASLYFTRDIMKGWDGMVKGREASEGVYIYKIKVIGANGEGKKEYVGHITLLR